MRDVCVQQKPASGRSHALDVAAEDVLEALRPEAARLVVPVQGEEPALAERPHPVRVRPGRVAENDAKRIGGLRGTWGTSRP